MLLARSKTGLKSYLFLLLVQYNVHLGVSLVFLSPLAQKLQV